MVQPKEITVKEIPKEQFRRFPVKEPVSETGKKAVLVLQDLKPDKPVMLERVSRGMQVSLSRQIKKNYPDVEMRVRKHSDRTRDIALLLKK